MANEYVDSFMDKFKFEGLTFDDISLITQYADFLPDDADVSTKVSRNISLKVPFVSAAMDTVTEANMAIAMACLGGIGVIHKNLSVEAQALEVARVKHHLNGLIKDPIVFHPGQTIEEMLEYRERKGFNFSGFPIVGDNGKIKGIFTSKDMKFLTDYTVKLEDVMTKELLTAPLGTTLQQAYDIMQEAKLGKLPIVDDEGHLIGLYSHHDVRSLLHNVNPNYNRDDQHRLRVAASIGPYDEARIEALVNENVDVLVIDTAHGDSKGVVDTLKMIKDRYTGVDVIAGNIASGSAAKRLLDAGADGIKVGIGPGSICTTRVVAGVGVPQITAIYEAYKATGGEIPIIADGGIKQSGDVAKALAVGASCVMMGSAIAGTEESPGDKIIHQGRKFVVYRGMGSLEAMKVGKGSRERYGQRDVDDASNLVPQGIEGMVPFRGTVGSVIHQFTGGVRYSLGYCGTKTIKELHERAKFVRVSSAGLREAHPHDVTMVKDAPNYTQGS